MHGSALQRRDRAAHFLSILGVNLSINLVNWPILFCTWVEPKMLTFDDMVRNNIQQRRALARPTGVKEVAVRGRTPLPTKQKLARQQAPLCCGRVGTNSAMHTETARCLATSLEV